MKSLKLYRRTPSFIKSVKAIAIPVTFLILFVSIVILTTVTYYFSITQINSKLEVLKVSGAEQEVVSLEKVMNFVAWSPGSHQVYTLNDYGGKLNVLPYSRNLTLTLKDGNNLNDTFFNSSIGRIDYDLPHSSEYQDNLFLVGDNRAIVNQSNSVMDQVYYFKSSNGYAVSISYRPLVGSTNLNSDTGPAENNLKVYIISLAASPILTQEGDARLRISSTGITTKSFSYNFSSSITVLTISALADGKSGNVSVPILSNNHGASVDLEILTCNIEVESVGW